MKVWPQIASDLRARIATGEWAYESRLPSSAELCRDYEASCGPIEQALAQLAREGMIRYAGAYNGWRLALPQSRRHLVRDLRGVTRVDVSGWRHERLHAHSHVREGSGERGAGRSPGGVGPI